MYALYSAQVQYSHPLPSKSSAQLYGVCISDKNYYIHTYVRSIHNASIAMMFWSEEFSQLVYTRSEMCRFESGDVQGVCLLVWAHCCCIVWELTLLHVSAGGGGPVYWRHTGSFTFNFEGAQFQVPCSSPLACASHCPYTVEVRMWMMPTCCGRVQCMWCDHRPFSDLLLYIY